MKRAVTAEQAGAGDLQVAGAAGVGDGHHGELAVGDPLI